MRAAMTRAIFAGVSSPADGDPLAPLVKLADDPRPHRLIPVIELLLQLVLDDRALFFDNEHLFEAARELTHPLPLQRPDHGDLVETQADLRRLRLVDAEIVQRLPDVEVDLAGGDGGCRGRCG